MFLFCRTLSSLETMASKSTFALISWFYTLVRVSQTVGPDLLVSYRAKKPQNKIVGNLKVTSRVRLHIPCIIGCIAAPIPNYVLCQCIATQNLGNMA